MNNFSREQLQSIGFSFVMENLEPVNCYGQEKKKNIQQYGRNEKQTLFRELRQLDDFIGIRKTNQDVIDEIIGVLAHFKEIRGILRRIEDTSAFLDEVELFEIKNFAIDMNHLIKHVNRIHLNLDQYIPFSLQAVIDLLNPYEQVTRTFAIFDQYSEALTKIRKQKQQIEARLSAQENRQEILLKRNEIIEAERLEENRIKRELTDQLRKYLHEIHRDILFIAELDFLIAKSSLAIRFSCVKPDFTETESIKAQNLVNPMVVDILKKDGKTFTPINISLKDGANVLTGANMGGKTVTLATLTLNILLAHCGFFVFGEQLTLPVLDYIFFLSNDYQSITEGLSSFGAEVKEVTGLIEKMQTHKGFCALDEFTKGTNPEEGEMMVRAFLQLAEQHRAFCLLSTHLSGVVMEGMQHFQVVGLKNANLDELTLKKARQDFGVLQELMDFNIENVEWNSAPPRDAVRVAELMGIQKSFLDLVKEQYKETE